MVGSKYNVGVDFSELEKILNEEILKVLGKDKEKKKNNSFGSYFIGEDGKEFYIKEVIYNAPAVIVMWSDGTKTTSVCDAEDTFVPETGLILCVLKKLISNKMAARLVSNWVPSTVDKMTRITLKDVLKKNI